MLYCADYYSPHLLGDSFLRLKLIYCGRIMGSSNHREPAGTSLSATACCGPSARTRYRPTSPPSPLTGCSRPGRGSVTHGACAVLNTKGRAGHSAGPIYRSAESGGSGPGTAANWPRRAEARGRRLSNLCLYRATCCVHFDLGSLTTPYRRRRR